MTSHTWATALIMLLANVLPMFGVEVRSEDLTQALTTIINIVGPLYLYFRGVWTGHFTLGGTRLSR
jgi:hypothetical protein